MALRRNYHPHRLSVANVNGRFETSWRTNVARGSALISLTLKQTPPDEERTEKHPLVAGFWLKMEELTAKTHVMT